MNDGNNIVESYLSTVSQRLENEGFHIQKDVIYKEQKFEIVAKKTKFEIDKLAYAKTLFMLARFPSVDRKLLKNFSMRSFSYAERGFIIPWPRGFFFGVICYPVVIVDIMDDDTSEFIRHKAPRKHWSANEMPVVYSLESGTLYYCEVTPKWGGIYYENMRVFVNYILAP